MILGIAASVAYMWAIVVVCRRNGENKMSGLDIHQIKVLGDNYVHLLHDRATGKCAAVDPGKTDPVKAALDSRGWELSHILITHDHADHTGGNRKLKQAYGCKIVGSNTDRDSIPGLDIPVSENDVITIGESECRVMEIPGHTRGHVAYYFENDKALFTGDTMFVLGCGRLFGCTPEQMWTSLSRIRRLPGDTLVYCAHEYSQDNARFALGIDRDNADLVLAAEKINRLRAEGKSTVPSTIADEIATNPFLRADVAAFQQSVGLAGLDPVAVFAEIRRRKDNF